MFIESILKSVNSIRLHRHTDPQLTDATDHTTHASATAGVDNELYLRPNYYSILAYWKRRRQ